MTAAFIAGGDFTPLISSLKQEIEQKMNSKTYSPTATAAWSNLTSEADTALEVRITDLFAADSQRADKLSVSSGELFLDFSKHHLMLIVSKLLNYKQNSTQNMMDYYPVRLMYPLLYHLN